MIIRKSLYLLLIFIILQTLLFFKSNENNMLFENLSFSFYYPENWYIDEEYDFSIISYDPNNNDYNPGYPIPDNELKMEIHINHVDYNLINISEMNITNLEDIKLFNGDVAKIFIQNDNDITSFFIIYKKYFINVIFNCYPYNSIYLKERNNIIKSFNLIFHKPKNNNVKLYKYFSDSSDVIETLNSDDILFILNDHKNGEWKNIITENNKIGWIRKQNIIKLNN